MFERFTDRARRALVLAQEEARTRRHGYLGTEHVLLGVIAENLGVGAKAIEALGSPLDAVQADVIARMGPPTATEGASGGPPFTPKATKALELSLQEALRLGHNYIGTEHLLLGLAAQSDGIAGEVLTARGITLTDLRRVVVELLQGSGGQPAPRAQSQLGSLSPAAEVVMRSARARAGNRPIGTHDVLVALLEPTQSAAVVALTSAGFDLEKLRAAAQGATTVNTSDQTEQETVASQLDVRVEGERIVITVENQSLLTALTNAPDATSALSGTDPRVAHDLGSLWQQISTTLTAALERLTEETNRSANDDGR